MKLASTLRIAFLVCGIVIAGGIFGARVIGLHADEAMGPAQRQLAGVGVLLIVLGAMTAPARFLAGAIERAGMQDEPRVRPLSALSRTALVVIVLIGLSFRAVMIRSYWPANEMVSGMTLWDAEMARNLLHGRGWVLNWSFVQRLDRAVVERNAMVDPQDFLPADDERPGALAPLPLFAHTPGYSMWLAIAFAIGHGLRFGYSQWMQAALDASAALLVFGIGRRLWSPLAGTIGALMYALSPAHVYLSIQTVAAATDSFWTVLMAYGLVRVWTDRQRQPFPIAGLACIVVATVCETAMNSFLFWLPAIFAAWALVLGCVVAPARRLALPLAAAQVAAVVLLTPWAIRNERVYGQFAYTRQQFWEFVWELPIGNVPNPWGMTFGNNDEAYERWIAARCPSPCTSVTRETITRQFLFADVLRSPQFPPLFLRATLKRLPALVYASRLPVDKPFVGHSGAGRLFAFGLRVLNIAALAFWPLAALGLAVVTRRAGAPAAWLALAPTLFLIAFSLVFNAEHRKTTPAYGYLMALSGVGVAACVERSRVHTAVTV
ncbi:MAG TPA: hypothetical protein VFA59_25060 [Vicinamibacterales bacterium]|nr:hypothetical protein [Vicinamibacterales bacterium]